MSSLPTAPSSPSNEPIAKPNREPKSQRAEGYRAWLVLLVVAKLSALVLLLMQHYTAALVFFFLPAPWFLLQIFKPSARGLGPAVTHFKTTRREVWLTIDDGPHPLSTPAVLDLLDAHGARATFFLIGEKVLRHPALVAEILRRGHTIGNHTQTHPCASFWCASARRTAAEIDACAQALHQAGAVSTQLFRPPVGIKNHALHRQLAKRDLDLILWSVRGCDTVSLDPAKTLARITRHLAPGAILLIHENATRPAMRTALFTALLTHLAAENYTCVIPPRETLIRKN